MMRSIRAFVAVAAVVAIAGCGGGDTQASSDDVSSPLGEFLGEDDIFFGDVDEDEAQERFIAEERERQAIIAECMREQGFEYTPTDPEQYVFFGGEGEDGLEYGEDEWIAKYGFGISTQRFSQESVGPDLVGYDDSFDGFDSDSDPNFAYLESLSESEQEAYQEALYGDDAFGEFDDTLSEEEQEAAIEDIEWEPSGCEGEAYTEVSSTNRFFTEFEDELNELYERVEADPRIAEAEQEISDCVADRGLDYTDMEDLYESFESRLSELESEVQYPSEELDEDDFAQMSPDELDEIFNQPAILSDEAKATLAEIQAEEIELAVAVDECGGGFEDQEALYREVVAEYEQQFIDENEDRLTEFRDAE